MSTAHRNRNPGPARAGGFPSGLRVHAHGGRFTGRTGVVVCRAPDLRPGSVWVEFSPGDARLVPGYRLDVQRMSGQAGGGRTATLPQGQHCPEQGYRAEKGQRRRGVALHPQLAGQRVGGDPVPQRREVHRRDHGDSGAQHGGHRAISPTSGHPRPRSVRRTSETPTAYTVHQGEIGTSPPLSPARTKDRGDSETHSRRSDRRVIHEHSPTHSSERNVRASTTWSASSAMATRLREPGLVRASRATPRRAAFSSAGCPRSTGRRDAKGRLTERARLAVRASG